MASKTKELLFALVAKFEGFFPRPYLCPAGVPTIGFGTTFYPDGRRVSLSDPAITREQAYDYAWSELNSCLKNAVRYSPELAEDDEALAAIADFIFNLGAGAYKGSTLRKRINADDREGAKVQILKWIRAGGKSLRGLLLRRQAEALLL